MTMDEDLQRLINAKGAIAALATTGEDGAPHVVYKAVRALDADTLAVPEVVETSESGKNMLRAVWEDRRVAVNVLEPATGKSVQLKGAVTEYVFFGPVFEEMFERLDPVTKTGVAGVWLVHVDDVRDNSLGVRIAAEVERHLRVYWERTPHFAPYTR
jgi:hypothetical protein